MKRLIILGVVMLEIATAHAQSVNFSGSWVGTCVKNGVSEGSKRTIVHTDANSITIEGEEFPLNAPKILNSSGVDTGQEWQERTVYDWQWNEDKTAIITNARWLGSYVNQHGSWSGRGTGKIEFVSGNLVMTRNFEQEFNGNSRKTDEVCTYTRL